MSSQDNNSNSETITEAINSLGVRMGYATGLMDGIADKITHSDNAQANKLYDLVHKGVFRSLSQEADRISSEVVELLSDYVVKGDKTKLPATQDKLSEFNIIEAYLFKVRDFYNEIFETGAVN